jgi:signal transduction histidine kinase/CheY-like chemotaxis protein/HPt (histidine-containing phosphotransfer) domain-containing protein
MLGFLLKRKKSSIRSYFRPISLGVFGLSSCLLIAQYITRKSHEDFLTIFIYSISFFFAFSCALTMYLYEKQKRNEKQRNRALSEARSALQAKSIFLANMSHEIRTPMNGIMGMTNLLLETNQSPQCLDMLQSIKVSGDALLTIINDILDISKIESGKLTIEKRAFDLKKLIKDTMKSFSEVAQSKNIELQYLLTPTVPQAIFSDEVRIKQILINLIGNAIKFTNEGSVKLTISSETVSFGIEKIIFEIKDTGIGIPKEQQEKLFSTFSQADSTTTRKYGGTGLGLSIARKLAQVLGGEVQIDSLVGNGSTFTFHILTEIRNIDDVEKILEITKIENLAKDHPLKILIVEDNLVNQKLACSLLTKYGYTPDLADDGLEAVEATQYKNFDLIFMDMQMPRMDGVEATQIILEHATNTPPPRIVAMTANAFPEDKKRCQEAGMTDFISKPINFKEVSRVLVKTFDNKKINSTEKDTSSFFNVKTKIDSFNAQTPKEATILVFNKQSVLENFSEDLETLELLFNNFLNEKCVLIDNLTIASLNDDFANIQFHAHTLKGAISNFYAEETVLFLQKVENVGRSKIGSVTNKDLETIVNLLEKFESEFQIFLINQKAG